MLASQPKQRLDEKRDGQGTVSGDGDQRSKERHDD